MRSEDLARPLLCGRSVKRMMEELTREAQERTKRAQMLRARVAEVTADVDGLVIEARTALRRSVEFLLEREGLCGPQMGVGQAQA